jgi:hypothetical protein
MTKKINVFILIFVTISLLSSCNDDSKKVFIEKYNNNVIQSISSDDKNEIEHALTFIKENKKIIKKYKINCINYNEAQLLIKLGRNDDALIILDKSDIKEDRLYYISLLYKQGKYLLASKYGIENIRELIDFIKSTKVKENDKWKVLESIAIYGIFCNENEYYELLNNEFLNSYEISIIRTKYQEMLNLRDKIQTDMWP